MKSHEGLSHSRLPFETLDVCAGKYHHEKGIADKAVCLMDLADDFGVHDDAQYLETYETAIAFAKEHPDTLWCYGNHDLSYIWGKQETGYHPEKRGLVCQEIKKLTNTLPKKSQLAYIHKIDKTLFMHGGLANLFVQLRVAPQNQKMFSRLSKLSTK